MSVFKFSPLVALLFLVLSASTSLAQKSHLNTPPNLAGKYDKAIKGNRIDALEIKKKFLDKAETGFERANGLRAEAAVLKELQRVQLQWAQNQKDPQGILLKYRPYFDQLGADIAGLEKAAQESIDEQCNREWQQEVERYGNVRGMIHPNHDCPTPSS